MIDKDLVTQLVTEELSSSDNFLVDVSVTPDNSIVVEIDNDESVSIDDCISLSKYLEEHLDRNKEDFNLEVGSAGITSPFKTLRQYHKYIGKEVEMMLHKGPKMKGILKDADDSGISISVEKKVKPEGAKKKISVTEDLHFTLDEIKYTKYIISFK